MPRPTIDTFTISVIVVDRLRADSRPTFSTSSSARRSRRCATVKVRSVVPSCETFWMIMSTTMFASASGAKIRPTMPGSSFTPRTRIFASSRS